MFWFVNLMRKENYKITNLTSIYTINTSKNKKITTLQTLQKHMVKNCMHGILHYCLKITKLQTLQCISIVNSENYCKYYKITDITNHSNIYVLVCQSNAERKLQNYEP